jgi:FKBP-type peptidyl-prolyl cis-trans isomerase
MAKGAKMELRQMLMAGVVLLGSAVAQQPPAKNPAPAAKSPAAQLPEAPAAKAQTPSAFSTEKEKVSYAIGMNVGSGLHKQEIDVDPNVLFQGLKDGLSGGKTLMTDEEVRATFTQLQASLKSKQEEKLKVLGEANKKEGDAFLAANKAKEGVVTLPSGLQYKILQQGTGPKPTASDTVVCNYKGTLINGTEFDSSYKRGQPATFPVGRVIKGWTEALQLMPTGSKWQLFIPSDMAYGDHGAGNDIGPNATLIFEVELVSIQEKPKPAAAPAPNPEKK